jgi:hypothetical protein
MAGGIVTLLGMGASIPNTYPSDYGGTPVGEIPLMQEVENFDDIAFVMEISAGTPGTREWVQQVQGRYRVALGSGTTAVGAPNFYPYVQSGQLSGLLGGLKGAAEYETLVGHPGDPASVVWGYWVAAILTISIYSFLYKDNPLYKFVESLFVGIGAAYWMCLLYHETLVPKLIQPLFFPLEGDPVKWIRIFPGILAIFMLLRFYPKLSWLSRWSLGFIVGMYSAVNITGFGQGDFVTQIYATMTTPLRGTGTGEIILNIVAVGIWFLMVAFGASFGYTVMGRVSLLIGRMTFMLRDWLHLID